MLPKVQAQCLENWKFKKPRHSSAAHILFDLLNFKTVMYTKLILSEVSDKESTQYFGRQ
jgi:hypothetical protein